MRKRADVRAVIALASASLSVLFLACSPAEQKPNPPALLVGAWTSKVQFADGAFAGVKDLEFLYTFNEGGTMTESSNYDGAPPVPPAYGIWRATGKDTFESHYVFYTTKAPAKFDDVAKGGGWLPAGRGVLRETYRVSADGQSLTSELTLELFNQADHPLPGGGKATSIGTRVTF